MGLPHQPSRNAATMAGQARVTRDAAMRAREVTMLSAAASAMAEQAASPSAPFMVQNLTKCLGSPGKRGEPDRERDAVQLRAEGETRGPQDADFAPSTSASDGPVLCWETSNGAKWQYLGDRDAQVGKKWIQVVNMQPQHNVLAVSLATHLREAYCCCRPSRFPWFQSPVHCTGLERCVWPRLYVVCLIT